MEDLVGGDPEHAFDLLGPPLGLGLWEVDLVECRHDREVVLEREVAVGKRLRFDPLGRVDEQERAFTCGEAARHLVPEVDVAGRVDQVEDVVLPVEPHVLRLDGDAPLALQVHRVHVLGAHVARVDGARELQDPVGERGLAVVDVGHDRQVPDALDGGHTPIVADDTPDRTTEPPSDPTRAELL